MQLGRTCLTTFSLLAVALVGGCELDLLSGDSSADAEGSTADAGGTAGPACTPRACGPAPGAPNFICDDGSLGGPGECQRDPRTGVCGYPWRECPDADAGAGALDAGPAPSLDGSTARCGTRGGVQCGAEQFCNFELEAQCGALDHGGVCETKPEACITLYRPVCGCDNRSYSLDCQAHGAGVSVKHEGLCSPAECTAAGGKPKYSTGADIPSCAAGEEQWSLSGGIEPVICCLPKPDPSGGQTCGGIAGLSCDDGFFCNYEPAAGGQGCEGIADAAGVCEPARQACTLEYAPVCGCDRRTYATRCVAHSEGVSVLHDGACTEVDCAAIGGKAVDGLGPAPMCARGDVSHGSIVYASGSIAIEGTICCVRQ